MEENGTQTFQEAWDERIPLLEAARERSGGAYGVSDVHDLVCDGLAHFEPLEKGVAIFLFQDYPQRRFLRIWLAGGKLPGNIDKVLDVADDHAKRLKCDGIEVEGRRGWEKILKSRGYNYKRAVLIKDID